jgi:hypothetical protein
VPARPSTSPCACWAAASGCTCGSPSPDPGRILTETNLDTGVVTEFTVAPRDGRSRTLAGMSSEWETQGGLRGLADRLVTPRLMGRMFAKQLHQLDQYLGSTHDRLASDPGAGGER